MKHLIIVVFIISFANPLVFAQSDKDKIKVERVFGGVKYTKNNRVLKMNDLVRLMQHDELAYPKIKSARLNNTLATLLGASGGILVGWPIGTAIANGDPNWTLAYVGAALIVVSIPVSIMGTKQSAKAVHIFNENLLNQAFLKPHPDLRFNLTGAGLGLSLHF